MKLNINPEFLTNRRKPLIQQKEPTMIDKWKEKYSSNDSPTKKQILYSNQFPLIKQVSRDPNK